MQVRELDLVVVEDPDPADARAGQVERDRRAERARADHEHARLAHGELRGRAPLGQDELARVALDLGVGEIGRRRAGGSGSIASLADATTDASSRKKPRRLLLMRATIRIVVPSTVTAWPASRAERGTFSSASPGAAADLERLAGGHPLELELRPHPRHRAGQGGDVERPRGHQRYRSGPLARSFLILHGYEGSGPEHWQSWLAERLRAAGERVAYPDLPDAAHARAAGLARRAGARSCGRCTASSTVIAHSLACILWLHHCDTPVAGDAPRRAACCSSPRRRSPARRARSSRSSRSRSTAIASPPRRRRRGSCARPTTRTAPRTRPPSTASRSGSRSTCSRAPAHVNVESGYGPWPAAEAWCYGASAITSSRIAPG